MQIFSVLTVVTAIFSSSASATCFHSGEHWGNKDDARSKLEDACNHMQGNFKAGEIKHQCRDGKNFHAYAFEVHNQNAHPVKVSHNACVENIRREIKNCGQGGQETFNGIKYRGDPNKGTC